MRAAFSLIKFLKNLFLSVDQPTGPVSEQDVDLLQIQHCSNFALTEMRMHHRLPFLIFTCPIVG